MNEKKLLTHDGIQLNYAVSEVQQAKPWIALLFPFGLRLDLARHFFELFRYHYNIVVWEARSILEGSDRPVAEGEFTIENHLRDMRAVLETCPAKKFIVVGYCSGAGLALAAANRYPNMIHSLVLVHGEYTMLNDPECTTQFASEIDSLLSLAARDEEHLQLVFEKIRKDRIEENGNRPDGIDLPFSKLPFLRRHCANYLSYKDVDFEHLARCVVHRTFLLSGRWDAQANVASTEKIATLIPGAQVYIDPEADHYGLLREDSTTLVAIWNHLYEERSNAA